MRMGHAETCSELKNIFAALVKQSKPPENSDGAVNLAYDGSAIPVEFQEPGILSNGHDWRGLVEAGGSDPLVVPEAFKETDAPSIIHQQQQNAGDSLVVAEYSKDLQHGSLEPSKEVDNVLNEDMILIDASREEYTPSNGNEQKKQVDVLVDTSGNANERTTNSDERKKQVDHLIHTCTVPETSKEPDEQKKQVDHLIHTSTVPETSKEPDTVSNNPERKKPVFRIKVKKSAASSRADDIATKDKSLNANADGDRGASSSVSVDAPQRNFAETTSTANQALQNLEDVNSCHDVGSRVTASIGSAKLPTDGGDELHKELQCTADSGKFFSIPPTADHIEEEEEEDDHLKKKVEKYVSLQSLSVTGSYLQHHDKGMVKEKERDKKKDKEKKRKREHKEHKGHRNDPEYLEKKRLKKEKKRKEKEMAKLLKETPKASSRVELQSKKDKSPSVGPILVSREHERRRPEEMMMDSRPPLPPPPPPPPPAAPAISGPEKKTPSVELQNSKEDPGKFLSGMQQPPNPSVAAPQTQNTSSQKLKIKFKKRTLEKPS